MWLGSDLLITGHPLWSLTNTRHTATTLDRVTGIANVPEYIPRRIGEILRPAVLPARRSAASCRCGGAAAGAVRGPLVGVLAVLVFAAFATVGLPINTRYAFLAAAILACSAAPGYSAGRALEPSDPRRRSGWRSAPSCPSR